MTLPYPTPTTKGWYWARHKAENHWIVVEVYPDLDKLVVYTTEDLDTMPLSAFAWGPPIPLPPELES